MSWWLATSGAQHDVYQSSSASSAQAKHPTWTIAGPYSSQGAAQAAVPSIPSGSSGSPGSAVQQGVGQVPATLINWAAGVIGINPSIVAAQIVAESGGDPSAVSPTGAQGAFQFEPGTWSSLGCGGSPFNVGDGAKCYATYMYQLVQQFHGNVRDALAAYNAGPGNLAAGYGYADSILSAAGQPQGATASGGTGAAGATATLAAQNTRCLVGGNTFIPCLLDASQARGLIGGLCLFLGGTLFLGGVVLVVAIGAGRSPVAGVIPGPAGKVIRKVS